MSGDTVNMYGGEWNTGIAHHHAPAAPPTLEQALATVLQRAGALREAVPEADREALETGLAELDAPADGPSRRRTLIAIAGIAATVGAVGQPLLDAVRAALELLAA
ncbi:hypothetical protein [Streptomyces sp. NPDC085466]|uniref:hypothetical protein n=1 Tax=Streptomyces sp. NPDC085466 TaxID=3365725 RepID=UPI0037D971B7